MGALCLTMHALGIVDHKKYAYTHNNCVLGPGTDLNACIVNYS